MEVMLPRSSPGAVNGRRWEITSRGQVGSTSGHLAAAISSEVTSNGGLDRIGSPNRTRRTSSPIEPTGSPTRRRINSPRAMPLLSVASLSASFHTDTTMSRFPKFSLFSYDFLLSLFVGISSSFTAFPIQTFLDTDFFWSWTWSGRWRQHSFCLQGLPPSGFPHPQSLSSPDSHLCTKYTWFAC